MERRKFTREFKLEAVKLIQERGVTVTQAARDLGVHGTVLRRWVQECAGDAQQAFPGQGQMKPEQAELARLRREVIKLKAERDILKMYGPPPGLQDLLRREDSWLALMYPACS
jgi:transposase